MKTALTVNRIHLQTENWQPVPQVWARATLLLFDSELHRTGWAETSTCKSHSQLSECILFTKDPPGQVGGSLC